MIARMVFVDARALQLCVSVVEFQTERSCAPRKERDINVVVYAYAAPTMIFLIRMYGDPCEMLLVCVGCPFASPPVPNMRHESWPPSASRFAQKSVVIAL